MPEMSDFLKEATYQATLRGDAFPSPTNLEMSLWENSPLGDASGPEVSDPAYARQVIVFTDADPGEGEGDNTGEVVFDVGAGAPYTVTWAAIHDSDTGDMLLYSLLDDEVGPVTSGDFIRFPIGNVEALFR